MSRLVLFTHLPKTAGRSLQAVIRANYGHGELAEVYGTPRSREWYRLWWGSMPEEHRQRLRCVAGHGTSFLVPELDRPFRMLCVLRHPVDRVLSLHRFLTSRYERRRDRLSLGSRAERTAPAVLARSGYTVEDVIRRRIEAPSERPAAGGYFDGQSRLLAAAYPDIEVPRAYDPAFSDRLASGLAASLLERMSHDCLVGVHDRLAESVDRFRRVLGWRSVSLPHRNPGTGSLPATDLSLDVRELILAHNPVDLALYEHYAREMA